VIGSGRDEAALRSYAEHVGVGDRVRLVGQLPREDLVGHMAKAEVLLMPSLHDDAPWVVAEAVAAGLPVVCLDRGGPPIIGGRAATVVSSRGSASEIAARLGEVLRRREFPARDVTAEVGRGFSLDRRRAKLQEVIEDRLPWLSGVGSRD
jgi:glycosyltransferase involved in cell wall biosynthesis